MAEAPADEGGAAAHGGAGAVVAQQAELGALRGLIDGEEPGVLPGQEAGVHGTVDPGEALQRAVAAQDDLLDAAEVGLIITADQYGIAHVAVPPGIHT